MNEAQLILDTAAIGISVYTLIRLFETKTDISFFKAALSEQTLKRQDLEKDIEQIIQFQKEMNEVEGMKPGVYLPKKNETTGEVDYVPAIDAKEWQDIINS